MSITVLTLWGGVKWSGVEGREVEGSGEAVAVSHTNVITSAGSVGEG